MSYLVHLGYLVSLAAFLARDILLVRSLLIAAQMIVCAYALSAHVYPVAFWNGLFAVVNIVWVILIIRDRRELELPADLQPIYDKHFSALSAREFLRVWNLGRRETMRGARLATMGQRPQSLYFLLTGQVRVSRQERAVTELPAGFFVGEMSLLTGHPANATVDTLDDVEVIRWPVDTLRGLRQRQPSLWIKIQSAIGYDLVQKILRGDERLAGV